MISRGKVDDATGIIRKMYEVFYYDKLAYLSYKTKYIG